MSFLMTQAVTIGPYKSFPATSLSWKRCVFNYCDTATVRMPTICRLIKNGDQYTGMNTAEQFTEGMPIEIRCGYDYNNQLRFKGFVRRINFTVPLEVECEGYSYLLRKVVLNKTYVNTTVKAILEDLTAGTLIRLSDKIPNIPMPKAWFNHANGLQVLDWMKEKCLLTVYFIYDELYVGLQQVAVDTTVKFRIGWNVIKDNELKFNNKKELADVRINVVHRKATGKLHTVYSGPPNGGIKQLKSILDDDDARQAIADQKRLELINKGYEGKLTVFGVPLIAPGEAADIDDNRYPERKGKYFTEAVDGEFGPNGIRQILKIGYTLS